MSLSVLESLQPPICVEFKYIYPFPLVIQFGTRTDLYRALGIPKHLGDRYQTEDLRHSVIASMQLTPYKPVQYQNQTFPNLYKLAEYLHTDIANLFWLARENLLDEYEPLE